jgi:hypothetical protein
MLLRILWSVLQAGTVLAVGVVVGVLWLKGAALCVADSVRSARRESRVWLV